MNPRQSESPIEVFVSSQITELLELRGRLHREYNSNDRGTFRLWIYEHTPATAGTPHAAFMAALEKSGVVICILKTNVGQGTLKELRRAVELRKRVFLFIHEAADREALNDQIGDLFEIEETKYNLWCDEDEVVTQIGAALDDIARAACNQFLLPGRPPPSFRDPGFLDDAPEIYKGAALNVAAMCSQGKLKEAEATVQRIAAQASTAQDDIEARNLHAYWCRRVGKYAEALVEYKSLFLLTGKPRFILSMALVDLIAQDTDGARAKMAELGGEGSELPAFAIVSARIAAEESDYERALRILNDKKAVLLERCPDDYLLMSAEFLSAKGFFLDALSCLDDYQDPARTDELTHCLEAFYAISAWDKSGDENLLVRAARAMEKSLAQAMTFPTQEIREEFEQLRLATRAKILVAEGRRNEAIALLENPGRIRLDPINTFNLKMLQMSDGGAPPPEDEIRELLAIANDEALWFNLIGPQVVGLMDGLSTDVTKLRNDLCAYKTAYPESAGQRSFEAMLRCYDGEVEGGGHCTLRVGRWLAGTLGAHTA